RREELLQRDDRAAAGARGDIELIHQPAGTDDPDAHAGRRSIAALEDAGEFRDAGPFVGHLHDEDLWRRRALEPERDLAATRVRHGVARDLRDGGRDAGLVLGVEAEEAGDLARALARENDVALRVERERQNAGTHGVSRTTTTVASSRPRRKSR